MTASVGRLVRRGPADAAADMRAGDGWIMPRADAVRAGLMPPDPLPCSVCGELEAAEPWTGMHRYGPRASHDWTPPMP